MSRRPHSIAVFVLALCACGSATTSLPEIRIAPLDAASAPVITSMRRTLEFELHRATDRLGLTEACAVDAVAHMDDRGRLGLALHGDAAVVDAVVDLTLTCPDSAPVHASGDGSAIAPMGTSDPSAARHRAIELAVGDAVRVAVRELSPEDR